MSACLHRVSWLLHARVVEAKLRDLQLAVKAGFDPNQPRVPAGNPDGGQWTGSGGESGSGGERVGIGVGGASGRPIRVAQNDPPDHLKDFPEKRPPDVKLRNRAIRRLARFVLTLIREDELGREIGPILDLLNIGSWVADDYSDHLQSYIDPPKTLEELQRAVSSPSPGTQIHHIVEQGPAEREKFPRSQIDGADNLVRIPTLKHEEITGWFGTPNDEFGGLSPREYLRGRGWPERRKMGLDALILFEVLEP